jgi:hypothetical protein
MESFNISKGAPLYTGAGDRSGWRYGPLAVAADEANEKTVLNASGGGTLFYASDPDHLVESGGLGTGESVVISERTWLTASGGDVCHVVVLSADE